MKRFFLLISLLLSLPVFTLAQAPELFAFEGYLFSEDSVPVENAYLINYRTLKIVATDSTGYFKTLVQQGDSLMINHLTLSPKVIHAHPGKAKNNLIHVPFRTYLIKPVVAMDYTIQMKHFEKNMTLLRQQLAKLGYHAPVRTNAYDNPYNPDAVNPGVSLNLSELIRLIKKKK
ncbi:MAG: hypothetical protein AB7U05_15595 [Mangrovibacterium sp.]